MNCPQCQSPNTPEAELCFGCGRPLGLQGLRQGALIAGRYELLEPLGSGGMGMVFKAHDRSLDETVAIKVLRPEVAGQEEMARRFQSEIKLARRVRHPNVCAIHEYGEDGELRFITMEFIEGEDLRRRLGRDGALPPERAFDMSLQLAEGLQAIHATGIVHRDLKTPNIMLDARGLARLMDFGIAKRLDQQGTTSAGTVAGTPEYMSPEQARGEAVDFRTDIYGLGIVIFELFAGRVPFRADTPVATIFKHLQEAPPLTGVGAPRLPPALVPVLARALAKQPSQRYQDTGELIEALKLARSGVLPAPEAAGQATGAFWACPKCKRHVPGRVAICRCGHERVLTQPPRPVPAVGGPAPMARPRTSGLLLGTAAVLVAIASGVWIGWSRLRPEPVRSTSAPTPAPASRPPSDAPQAAAPVGVPTLIPLPDPVPVGDLPSDGPTPATSPSAEPAPVASPTHTTPADETTPAASDIDRLREEGTRSLDESLGALSRRVAEWRGTVTRCYGANALPTESPTITLPSVAVGSCSTTRHELVNVGDALLEAVARAEEDARRAWIPPGTQRTIRLKHGLDQDAVERLRTQVRALERD